MTPYLTRFVTFGSCDIDFYKLYLGIHINFCQERNSKRTLDPTLK